MHIRLSDGQKVAYVGDPSADHQLGDEGIVVSAGPTGSHVRWTTGARVGSIDLMHNLDVAAQGRATSQPSQIGAQAHSVFDRRGPSGLVRALRSEGHLDCLGTVAEDAESYLAATLRQEPSMREVLSSFDPEEAEEILRAAMAELLDDLRGEL